MDLLESMKIFVETVEKGSLTAAAAAAGISAPMAGNHLRRLEERVGIKLLNRTTRRQSLTPFGESYHSRCLEILRLVAQTDAHAADLQVVPKGRLRISAPVSFGTEALVPSLSEYMARYSEVQVDVVLCDRVVDLIDEGFEAAIRIGPLPDSGFISRALAPYRMMICAAPEYLERRGMPTAPSELAGHECLSFSYSPQSHWRLKNGKAFDLVPTNGRLQVNNGQALRVAALHGLGIIMQPAVLLKSDVDAGRLIQLFESHQLPSRPMSIVYLPDRHRSPKLRSFVEYIVEKFG